MNVNFRVFRRNARNLILLWSALLLTEEQRGELSVFLVNQAGDEERKLEYSKFVPDSPEKFAPDVEGMVLSHAANRLNPAEACTIKVIFGSGGDALEMVKEVLPANSIPELSHSQDQHKRVYLYAMNYSDNSWVPWPANGKLPANVQFEIKEK